MVYVDFCENIDTEIDLSMCKALPIVNEEYWTSETKKRTDAVAIKGKNEGNIYNRALEKYFW